MRRFQPAGGRLILLGGCGQRLLRRRGAWLVVPPASFIVSGTGGPLEPGEIEHARGYAAEVLQAIGIHKREASATVAG